MAAEIYDVTTWPVGPTYKELIRAASRISAKVGFVLRPGEPHLSDVATQLVASLADDLILAEEVWSWPGSELLQTSPPYVHHVYRCVPDVVSALASVSESFGDWVSPSLPEDVHFLRDDDSVVLGSIGQERFVWMELSPDDAADFKRDLSEPVRSAISLREV